MSAAPASPVPAPRPRAFPSWVRRLAVLAFVGVVLGVLFSEHRAHALGVLPYLLVLACPLLHLLHHRGHGAHGGHGASGTPNGAPGTPREVPAGHRHRATAVP